MATGLRGHIHWHDYGPVTGTELSGNRPALIISNSTLNQRLNTAITVPTSRSEPPQRFRRQHVWLNESESYASARQIKSVPQEELGDLIGRASNEEMQHIITSITARLTREQTPGHMETLQGLRLIQRGTVLPALDTLEVARLPRVLLPEQHILGRLDNPNPKASPSQKTRASPRSSRYCPIRSESGSDRSRHSSRL